MTEEQILEELEQVRELAVEQRDTAQTLLEKVTLLKQIIREAKHEKLLTEFLSLKKENE